MALNLLKRIRINKVNSVYQIKREGLEHDLSLAWTLEGAKKTLYDFRRDVIGWQKETLLELDEHYDELYKQSLEDVTKWEVLRNFGNRQVQTGFGRSFDDDRRVYLGEACELNLGNRFYRIEQLVEPYETDVLLMIPEIRTYGDFKASLFDKLLTGNYQKQIGALFVGLGMLGSAGLTLTYTQTELSGDPGLIPLMFLSFVSIYYGVNKMHKSHEENLFSLGKKFDETDRDEFIDG